MVSQESARQEIAGLVQKYKALSPHQRQKYKEVATRQGFILPLFRALGWNTDDTGEVSPEENVSRGFVDFAFRIGGVAKFFLETKRLPADLDDPRWAQQAINYSWTKGATWAVLCDFEGLRVYNAEVREADPRQAVFYELTSDSYLTDFDRLWWLSRPACEANTLDREADRWGKRTHKRPVGEQLLENLVEWRGELYRRLRQYNPMGSPVQIDEAVQRTLDRLVFIRTVEDRDVEPRRLIGLAREYKDAIAQRRKYDLIPRLTALFREYDAWYDSRLFEPHLLENLQCEPEPFVRVIEGLYSPDMFSAYDFNAIDADVLGAIYEQYLGHVAQERGKDAGEVEARKSKRKAQGIYYTPQFVVRYIVRQTLGRLLEERGLEGARNVRVLDPACGSGSFLIEAFSVLDDFTARATNQQPASAKGDFHDYNRRMGILTRNLYGVDLDAQAVEVAQLNLLLRAANQRGRLPQLQNIRQGNSLISGADEELEAAFGPAWRDKHPFNWEREFPDIFSPSSVSGEGRGGGFDVVIGNPPYVRQETLGEAFKTHAKDHYETYAGTADLYVYFIERAMSLLCPGGYLGFIVANKWMRAAYGEPLRRWLKQQHIAEVIDFGDLPVFEQATTYPCILILRKSAPARTFAVTQAATLDFATLEEYARDNRYDVAQDSLSDKGWSLAGGQAQALLAKLRSAGVPLGEYVEDKIYRGVLTGLNEAFVIDNQTRSRLVAEDPRSAELIKPFLVGRDIKRHGTPGSDRFVIFTRRGVPIDNYPAIKKHLLAFKDRLMPRPQAWQGEEWKGRKPGKYEWYEIQDTVDYYAEFEKSKILWPGISAEVAAFGLDEMGYYGNDNIQMIITSDRYLLGILNSGVARFILTSICDKVQGGFYRLKIIYIQQLPIRILNLADPSERAMHDRMVALVEEMLRLKREHAAAGAVLEDRRHALARDIERTDRDIDRLVYELYGLTDEEIKIVEGGSA